AIKRALRRGAAGSLRRGLVVELEELAPLTHAAETRNGLAAYGEELARQLALPLAEQPTVSELVALMDGGGPAVSRVS
ncbi:MAG: hypothetical protein M3680_26785, partial [Myxococcota bacterium]|nr:hypothetical protein [Myxococcota bacterium]